MNKTTFLFATLAVIFAGTTAFVSYRLLRAQGAGGAPSGVSGIAIGLPGQQIEGERVLRSASALLWDMDTQRISFEQNAFERRPMASLTKLMTAMVALDHGIPWEKEMEILPPEYLQGGKLLLHSGERVLMRDLFNASLLGSANNATLALVRGLEWDEAEFVLAMNRKAVEMGLEQTEFVEVTGLDPSNVSTAYEVARMAEYAFSNYPEIAQATAQKEYTFHVRVSDREHTIRNTNKLVSEFGVELAGSKTGYLYEAAYCLVVRGVGEDSDSIAVVLGSPSENDSLAEIQKLLSL